MGEEQSFKQMLMGKLNIHLQKNKVGSFPYTIYKYCLRTDQNLNIRAKPMKLLRENRRRKFLGVRFGNDFLDMPKGTENKRKKDKRNFIKPQHFCVPSDTINAVKRQPVEWEKYSQSNN